MSDPLVVVRMRQFKAALLAQEHDQMAEMARQWLGVERALDDKVELLARSAEEAAANGKPVTDASVWRLDHYRGLQSQAVDQVTGYTRYADGVITDGQRRMVGLGVSQAEAAMQLTYLQNGIVRATFDRLPVEAVNVMIGLAGNGQPVGDLLRLRMVRDEDGNPLPDVWEQLTRALINGTAQGTNPRLVARQMMDALAGGFNKALVIARSEQLRAYRMAAAQAYAESGVVTAQKRLATKDTRTCMACIAADGMRYPIDEPIPDHPQGRCTGVPVVKSLPETTWEPARDWFRQQSEADQRAQMGNGRWEAWNDGAFGFDDMITVTDDATWGKGLVPTALQDLI